MQRAIDSRSFPGARPAPCRAALAAALLLGCAASPMQAQSVTVSTVGDALVVRASGVGFIRGEPLARLRDGRSVRVDLELGVLAAPRAAAVALSRQTFVLSYDLWEERFAVTQAGVPARSVSHLTAAAAEAWCVEQVTVPVVSLGRLGRDTPLWIRLEYRVFDGDGASAPANGTGFTLQGLIDALSRRRSPGGLSHAIEAGPFRLRD